MARTIHCTVVETKPAADPYLPAPRGFQDLVPWADPYITALLTRLDHAHAEQQRRGRLRAELPPPLDQDDRNQPWEADWSERNWPRN